MKREYLYEIISLLPVVTLLFVSCTAVQSSEEKKGGDLTDRGTSVKGEQGKNVIDTASYDKIINALANNDTTGKWPVKAPYPLPGAILPYHRIVAFYGNIYSKRMGILGEIQKNQMLKKLQGEVAKWKAEDI